MGDQQTNKSPHVLLIPYPSQGHMNPIIEFGKRLISKGVKVTLIPTIYISNTIISHNTNTASFEIEPISDGFDEHGYAGASSSEAYIEKFDEVGSKSLGGLINKLQSEGNTIDAIVYDSFIPWALDVAMEFGINGGSFFTQACAVNNIYYHVYKGLIPVPLVSSVLVPGLPQFECWEAPSFVHNYGPYYYPGLTNVVLNQFANIDKARWVFTNTFYKLEEEVIEWMKKMWPMKVIGPTLPSMYLDKRLEDDKDYGINLFNATHSEYMNWLSDKAKGSVVYVSFGSIAQLGPEQMQEVAWGLNESNVNFLWVVRAGETEKLPKEFLELKTGKGLIVSWCKQLDVLAHESVGCFVTHCGFNSTLEAISLGVPVVGMPQWTDQSTNGKCLEDIWGVGVRVKADEKGMVTRANIVSCIKEIMDGERGVVAQNNARKWMELAKEAVSEGGSSDKDIDGFICELKQ
ncbi:UDP-glucuronosyl/UDP-glucosyltransferase [Artemisia annua]|uniref:Glycosyltransferase n=1 Tax=Artemisia annua TaxID=35608 RepID=A0A2U1N6P0_ARTAN|nr:UDP-glucuronosyl/UDP-glucosyltransferase [Artemisia annua]